MKARPSPIGHVNKQQQEALHRFVYHHGGNILITGLVLASYFYYTLYLLPARSQLASAE